MTPLLPPLRFHYRHWRHADYYCWHFRRHYFRRLHAYCDIFTPLILPLRHYFLSLTLSLIFAIIIFRHWYWLFPAAMIFSFYCYAISWCHYAMPRHCAPCWRLFSLAAIDIIAITLSWYFVDYCHCFSLILLPYASCHYFRYAAAMLPDADDILPALFHADSCCRYASWWVSLMHDILPLRLAEPLAFRHYAIQIFYWFSFFLSFSFYWLMMTLIFFAMPLLCCHFSPLLLFISLILFTPLIRHYCCPPLLPLIIDCWPLFSDILFITPLLLPFFIISPAYYDTLIAIAIIRCHTLSPCRH